VGLAAIVIALQISPHGAHPFSPIGSATSEAE